MTRSPLPTTMTVTVATLLLHLLSNLHVAKSQGEPEQSWVDKTKETTKQEIAAMFGEGKNSTTFIVVCVALGIILLIFILAIALCCSRRKKRQIAKMKKKRIESSGLPTTTTAATKTQKTAAVAAKKAIISVPPPSNSKIPEKSQVIRGSGVQHPIPITRPLPQIQPPPAPPAQSYFGTIQSTANDMDDVSTLGDPFMVMGGDVNARMMDADNTVGESMISSQQQLFIYGVGRQRSNTGNESRMDGTTVFSGSKNMLFVEDHTLEEIYEDSIGGQHSSSDEIVTVIAPKGPLGIVLDNPHGAIPVVFAVKETSSLLGKVYVGDLLLSVDEVDCRGMSSQNVSKFLNSRSQNVARKMVLSRSLGIVTGEAV